MNVSGVWAAVRSTLEAVWLRLKMGVLLVATRRSGAGTVKRGGSSKRSAVRVPGKRTWKPSKSGVESRRTSRSGKR